MSAFTTSFTGVRVVSKTAVAKKSVSTKAVASMENVKKVRASVARGDADRSIRGGDRAVAGVVRARAWTRRRDRASTRVRVGHGGTTRAVECRSIGHISHRGQRPTATRKTCSISGRDGKKGKNGECYRDRDRY